MNNSRKENLIIFTIAFFLIIGVIAFISLISGTLLKMFGISYTSMWSFILYMIFVTVCSYPLNFLVVLFLQVLLVKEFITEKTAIIAFVVLDALATFTTLHIVDIFMDSVSMTPLAMAVLGLVFAILSLPDKKRQVRLEELARSTENINISVRTSQSTYVLPINEIIDLANQYEDSKFLGIYTDNKLIGLVLYYGLEEKNRYILSQFVIDKKYQAKGFGKEALKQVLNLMKEERKYNVVALCVKPDNLVAEALYANFGFKVISASDEEIIMELYLSEYNN